VTTSPHPVKLLLNSFALGDGKPDLRDRLAEMGFDIEVYSDVSWDLRPGQQAPSAAEQAAYAYRTGRTLVTSQHTLYAQEDLLQELPGRIICSLEYGLVSMSPVLSGRWPELLRDRLAVENQTSIIRKFIAITE
jgi:hypothetical protein